MGRERNNYRHGHAVGGVTPTYRAWMGARDRCKHHPEYAGRGIAFDPRWDDFRVFLADMGECPTGLTLDRIDNEKGYEPGNCRWTTYSVQNSNQRRRRPRVSRHGNAKLTDAEVRAILTDGRAHQQIAEEYGVSRSRISSLKRGEGHKHLSRVSP